MNTDAHVLALFVDKPGQFVSGTLIGESIGLSRVSIHNHLEKLKAQGFIFSAIRNKGYRLEKEPDGFNPALFGALMDRKPLAFFRNYLTCESVGSTNSMAEVELAQGRECPFFILADQQCSGRGRRGRTWHSPPGTNLYLSIALRPALPPARMQTITLWTGLRLCQFLRDRFSLPVMVKWPNDLIVHDRKIAGILTEARVDAEQTRDLVLGIGLNVNATTEDFPAELRSIAGSLALCTGQPVNATRLAQAMVGALALAIEDFLQDRHAAELASQWPAVDYLRNQWVNTDQLAGRAIGISDSGSLRVQREDGSVAQLHSGEVSIGSGSPRPSTLHEDS